MRQLTETQQKIYDFVAEQHGTQVRKYSGEPYVNHCLEVAELVYKYTGDKYQHLWVAAICHDLFEDTKVDHDKLVIFLYSIDIEKQVALTIGRVVQELTDLWTPENVPGLNRSERKNREAKRLGSFGWAAQTIKYADIISNTRSIVAYDSKFALTYLPEKVQLLHYMRKGDINLYIQACAEVYEGLRSVGLLENYKFSV